MKFRVFALPLAILAWGSAAHADHVYEVPTAWRLQNYVPNGVAAYYVTAPGCTSGGIHLPASATVDDKNRLWSTILTAKATGKAVGIYYSGSGLSCFIDSFYLQN